jgi:predicted enzyme related to lactoylglutathione lyase
MADGAITWWELDVPNVEQAKQFYGAVCPWQFESMQGFEGYVLVKAGDAQIGALQASDAGQPSGRGVTLYVQVADLEDTLERARKAGGTVEHERSEVPGNQWFGQVRDPFGLKIGFLTSNPAS